MSRTTTIETGQEEGVLGNNTDAGVPAKPDGPIANNFVITQIQVSTTKDCSGFAYADANHTCYSMTQNFHMTKFTLWNQTLGRPDGYNCSTQFWDGYFYCGYVPGAIYITSGTSSNPSSANPRLLYPTRTKISPDCSKFAEAKAGDSCSMFAQNNDITTDELYDRNGILGRDGFNCPTEFQPGYNYRVSIIIRAL